MVNVKNNDEANIAIDAYPKRFFRGTVYQIANTRRVTTGANTQEEVTNFEVRIHIKPEEARLRPGMSATADVETATDTNVVAVPIQSVTVRNTADKLSPEERDKQKAKSTGRLIRRLMPTRWNWKRARRWPDRDAALQKRLQSVCFVKTKDDKVQMRPVVTGIADKHLPGGQEPACNPATKSLAAATARSSRLLKDGAKVMLEKAGQ